MNDNYLIYAAALSMLCQINSASITANTIEANLLRIV
jgi:hypothetical protein